MDEVATSQKWIDHLHNLGVNKIVLVTHYQYRNDLALAQEVRGVDVIIGGDSHTLLGDFSQYGLNSQAPYPTKVTSKDGDSVCIVQAWEYAKVVGELKVTFDRYGRVKNCTGTPHLLLGDTFKRKNAEGKRVPVAKAEYEKIMQVIAEDAQLSLTAKNVTAETVLKQYSERVTPLTQQVIGTAETNLCLERIPGEGKSSLCKAEETSQHGSDISNLVALAFRNQSVNADIALQNGGGVRTDIAVGEITIGTSYKLLPFKNTLVNLTMTGQEIVETLEDAVDFALTGSTGAYPYAAGLRYHVDISQVKGKRIDNVQVKLKKDTSWSAIELNNHYIVVTNDYIASGKDGYAL